MQLTSDQLEVKLVDLLGRLTPEQARRLAGNPVAVEVIVDMVNLRLTRGGLDFTPVKTAWR